jgi:phenylacetate-CoA ligase
MKRAAGVYWGNELAGWQFGEPTAYLWGVDDSGARSKRDAFNRFLKNEIVLNVFNMNADSMKRFHNQLLRFRVRFIIGYASSLCAFFTFLKENKLYLPSLKGVISSAEVLSEKGRYFLEKECGLSVFNRYGSREFGLIAAECPAHKGMHICTENVYVEIEKYKMQGEKSGEILVTGLINYAMPFIRYKIEDIGSIQEGEGCLCGRPFPKLLAVKGRSSSVFKTKDNELIHGEYFTHLLYGLKEIEKFQFVQKDLDKCILKVVPGRGFNPQLLDPVLAKMKKALKTDNIEISVMDFIEPTKSGKHIFTLSEVADKT